MLDACCVIISFGIFVVFPVTTYLADKHEQKLRHRRMLEAAQVEEERKRRELHSRHE